MEIKAADVKALRDKTGAGMMECKKALAETNGDAAAAEKLLKEKGLAAVGKRADRETGEGRVFIKIEGNKAAICELTCETDFVAKNEDFIKIGNDIVSTVIAKGYTEITQDLSDMLLDLATKIRENMTIRRLELVEIPANRTASGYVHSDGKTGVVTVVTAEPVNSALSYQPANSRFSLFILSIVGNGMLTSSLVGAVKPSTQLPPFVLNVTLQAV